MHNSIQRAYQELQTPRAGQIKPLDFLRAVAITSVIATHSALDFASAGGRSNAVTRFPLVQGGWSGVDLFFVLSGFFIGKQIWREVSQTGTVIVHRFVLRRGLRIWPLYFFFLIILAALHARTVGWDLLNDLFFVSNYRSEAVIKGGWSLSTEEQFYLVFPIFIWIACRWTRSLSLLKWGMLSLLLAAPLIRLAVLSADQGSLSPALSHPSVDIYRPFHTHFDGLVMGLFISNLYISSPAVTRASFKKWAGICIAALFVGISLRWLHRQVFNFTGLALIFGSLVYAGLSGADKVLPFVNGRIFHWVSRLSFGMYLNYRHPLPWLAQFTVAHGAGLGLPPWAQFSVLLLLVFRTSMAISFITFAWIELPFLRWRERIIEKKKASRGI